MKLLRSSVLVALLATGCQPVGGNGSEAAVPSGQAPAGETLGEMIAIPASDILYGASEEQYQMLLSTARINFPGMKERLRRMQVIPPEAVAVSRFQIDEFEVTNRQFAQFLTSTGYKPAAPADFLQHWKNGRYPDWAADFPVVWVAPEDAEAYCDWRGGRLPSDPEWERATRGGDARNFPWGNEPPAPETTNISTEEMEPVGNRPGDRSPFGVYDLGGNVSEIVGTVVPFEGRQVHPIRGGSFDSGIQAAFAFSRNLGIGAGQRAGNIGFRCAADPK